MFQYTNIQNCLNLILNKRENVKEYQSLNEIIEKTEFEGIKLIFKINKENQKEYKETWKFIKTEQNCDSIYNENINKVLNLCENSHFNFLLNSKKKEKIKFLFKILNSDRNLQFNKNSRTPILYFNTQESNYSLFYKCSLVRKISCINKEKIFFDRIISNEVISEKSTIFNVLDNSVIPKTKLSSSFLDIKDHERKEENKFFNILATSICTKLNDKSISDVETDKFSIDNELWGKIEEL